MNETDLTNKLTSVRNKIFKDSGIFLAGNLISQFISMVRPFVLLPLFSPSQLGVWNLMGVILGYGVNSHLGVLHGMNKVIPILRSEKKSDELEAMKNSSFWLNTFFGIGAGTVLWMTSWMIPTDYRSALQILSLAIFLQMIFTYYFCLLRAENRFKLVSKGLILHTLSSVSLVVTFALLFYNSLYGALFGLCGGFLVVLCYWFLKGGYSFPFCLNQRSIRMALNYGVPLIVISFADMILLSIDRWVIVANLGETSLGHYALGIMACNMLGIAPSAISSVLYPRMLERFGSTDKDPCAVQNLLTISLLAISGLMIIIISGTVLFLPYIIHLFLPKYVGSIPIVIILVPASYFLAIAAFGHVYMAAIDKQRFLLVVVCLAAIVCFSLDMLLLSSGYGLVGVSTGTTAGYITYGLGYVMMAGYFAFGNCMSMIRFLARLLLPYGVMIFALVVGSVIFSDSTYTNITILNTVFRFFLVLVLSLSTFWVANHDVTDLLKMEFKSWLIKKI